jgi:hypothetical protein
MSENYRKLEVDNFDYDPVNGVKQRLVIEQDGGIHLESTQNVDHILKAAHESRMNFSKHEKLGDDVKIASIPMLIQADLVKKGIWQDKKRLFQWLMNEGRPFLTRDISL